MEQTTQGASSQSDYGAGSSLPTPAEVQRPLALPAPGGGADVASTADKLTTSRPESSPDPGHGRFADEVHGYVREHIRNADQKATFFFAALTAILAFLNTQNVPTRWLKDPMLWSLVDILGFVSMLGVAAGAAILLAVVFPRLKGSRQGLLYFNAISEYPSAAGYANDVLASPHGNLVRAKLQHCYELSKVCSAKYRALRIGFWVGSIGSAAALLFLLFAKSHP
jgi:hypothetical protein